MILTSPLEIKGCLLLSQGTYSVPVFPLLIAITQWTSLLDPLSVYLAASFLAIIHIQVWYILLFAGRDGARLGTYRLSGKTFLFRQWRFASYHWRGYVSILHPASLKWYNIRAMSGPALFALTRGSFFLKQWHRLTSCPAVWYVISCTSWIRNGIRVSRKWL